MVNGIDIFREHFDNYKDQYTVIGGFACVLLMSDAGLDFRQTVDIDMVIIVEALTTEFAKAFWDFTSVGEDIQNFIAQIRETDIRLTDIGISRSKDSILDIYNNMYIVDKGGGQMPRYFKKARQINNLKVIDGLVREAWLETGFI